MAYDVASAIAALTGVGLIPFVTYSVSAVVPAGYVMGQNPTGGTIAKVNSQVVITVSTGVGGVVGSVVMPSVLGLAWQSATTVLAQASVSVDKYVWAVNVAASGSVVAQSIAAGLSVVPGTIVQLTLSAGPAKVPATAVVPVLT